MKKIIIAIISFTLAFSMTACTKVTKTDVTPETTTAVSETESIHDFEYTRKEIEKFEGGQYIGYYCEDDQIIRWECYNTEGKLEWYDTYEYNDNGNCVKESYYNGEGKLSSYYISEYTDDDRISLYACYSGDDTLQNKTIYEYNKNGGLIKESRYLGENAVLDEYIVYTYNENGYETSIFYYDGKDNFLASREYEYDANGNTTEEIHTDEEGVKTIITYEYDENGELEYILTKDQNDVISEEKYYKDGELDAEFYYTGGVLETVFTYLNNGDESYQIDHYENGKLTTIEICNEEGFTIKEIVDFGSNYYLYKYGEDGYKSEATFCNAVDDKVLWVSKYEYDEYGNCIKDEVYMNDELTEYKTFEYDYMGNETKRSVYKPDGTLHTYRENVYDEYGNLIDFTDYYADGTPIQ